MTHRELVDRARRWLRNTRRCSVVICEGYSGLTSEIPDAIGWRLCGRLSVLVECKTSRADFFRDMQKSSRRHGGVGKERLYMVPAGLIRPDEVPAGWGLLEVVGRRVLQTVAPEPRIDRDWSLVYELGMLFSQTRKYQAAASGAEWAEVTGLVGGAGI